MGTLALTSEVVMKIALPWLGAQCLKNERGLLEECSFFEEEENKFLRGKADYCASTMWTPHGGTVSP